MPKSYWQPMSLATDRDKKAAMSWFPYDADLTPYKAEVLCDTATDREKKARVFASDADGRHYKLTRSLGGRATTFTRACIPAPSGIKEE